LRALHHISQIPDFLEQMNLLQASEIFFKLKMLIVKIQNLIPDYKCCYSSELLPASFEKSLSKGLPLILEILSISYKNFIELNSQLQILKIFSLTTVLIRYEERQIQKYFIKQFKARVKNLEVFNPEIFMSLIHWFDTIEYIFDFLTSELTQMMDPPLNSGSCNWINSSINAQSKIVRLLSQKLGFIPNLWILSFFLNFDQKFYQEEVLRKSPQSFLWGLIPPQILLRSDSNPNFLLRSSLFTISDNPLFVSTQLLHEARLRLSVISSAIERKSLKDSLVNKRNEIKSLLIRILSNAILQMVKTNPSKAKELIMTKKSEFSPEIYKRLLMILEHQSKSEPNLPKNILSKPLKRIEIENRKNISSKEKLNKRFTVSGERLSAYRNKMSFQEMREHFKKDQEKAGQSKWRGLPKEKIGTRSPMHRKKDINEEKFHSQLGVKKGQKELKYGVTSEFQIDDKNIQ
jgi:hypothetical protein